MSTVRELSTGLADPPALPSHAVEAAHLASRYFAAAEERLATLPPKPRRSEEEQRQADELLRACRGVRMRFMEAHAEWLDAQLRSADPTQRLSELAFRAAEIVPGLAPAPAQLAREREFAQKDKEGREIDQGILFAGLLRSPSCGRRLLETMLQPTRRSLELLPQFVHDGTIALPSVQVEVRGRAAHLTIHNEHALNAEDVPSVEDMETAVDLALLHDGVHVGVLRGCVMSHPRYAGRRVFSAGINLKHLAAGQISFVDFLLRRELGYISKIQRGLHRANGRRHEKPWLAAVDSFAIGGGAQLLLVFDRVVAAADSYFSLPAAREGIVPGAANLRLTRMTGGRMARQIILGGRKVWASEPDASLLFDEVVDPAQMDAVIETNVRALDSPAVVANRHMLVLAEEPLDVFREYMAAFTFEQAMRLYAPDVMHKTFEGGR